MNGTHYASLMLYQWLRSLLSRNIAMVPLPRRINWMGYGRGYLVRFLLDETCDMTLNRFHTRTRATVSIIPLNQRSTTFIRPAGDFLNFLIGSSSGPSGVYISIHA